jgi:asparagine synthetase B (glutamine-hydrolysing)
MAASHATPSHWHTTLRRTKALLKDTYRSILPPHLFTLDKASFYPPLAKWIRREMLTLVEEALENTAIQPYFHVEMVRALLARHTAHETYALHTLSSILQLSTWFDVVYNATDE